MKTFHFLTGLPRSGSTLLSSILSQNPALYASPNSVLLELLFNVREHMRHSEQVQAFQQPSQERDVLLSIMEGMYRFTDRPHIIDKSRSWSHPHNIQMLTEILEEPPRMIATVRDLPAILTSFIALIERHPAHISYIDRALIDQQRLCDTRNRAEYLFSQGGTVYESWYTLKQCFDEGFGEVIHVVEYEDLITHPQETLERVYAFLGVPAYEHNFSAIENPVPENDAVYNIPHLHAIRPTLEKTSCDPKEVLGTALYAQYAAVPHFWRTGAQAPSLKTNPFTIRHGTDAG